MLRQKTETVIAHVSPIIVYQVIILEEVTEVTKTQEIVEAVANLRKIEITEKEDNLISQ